ncbi:MAG: carbohydrate-binding protein [Pontiellaceae bacterium]|nr:carbohydrate-binding protein [Pontiellaceae bacterium]
MSFCFLALRRRGFVLLVGSLFLVQLLPTAYAQQRGRPQLNAARTTFVADNGELLRGPFTSSEWGNPAPRDQLAKMKALGFNAVHLYGECLNINYPDSGDNPGYAVSRIDSVVNATRDLGMYVVITIGNGANNGNHNRAYALDFWKFYAGRYKDETHVIYEIHNEPVAWGPPYSSANANPTGALQMNVDAYKIIRERAPDTPVLFFTYAVLGGSGGASSALTDIRAFNTQVFGTSEATWTNEAVGFHGYAGAEANAEAVEDIIDAGYPCFMTEFASGIWGEDYGGLDVEAVANLERLEVSWLAFHYVPPWGVADDVTRPEVFKDRVDHSGLSWTADYGAWPVARSVYGNNGYPWTIPGYNNNYLSGSLRIQAENFDNGGNGIAYHNENSVNPGGIYRTNETVGIEATSDSGGGYNVGWTADGDWLEYTMKASAAGTYNLRLRVASTNAASVQLSAFGEDITGTWTIPSTGGLQTWKTVSKEVFLEPGQQVLRINVLGGGVNLNWIEFVPVSSGPFPNGTYKFLNMATSQAMGLDGNNNVAVGNYTGANSQQWTLQHVGAGQYRVTAYGGSQSWTTFAGPLHIGTWWGASGDRCFIFRPTGNGFYQVISAGGGKAFRPEGGGSALLEDRSFSGSSDQMWAITAPTAPSFPTGLSAEESGKTGAVLSWDAVSGATSYKVKRSMALGGPYTTVASGVTDTSYTDSGLIAGMQYYYVVSAVSNGTEGLNSAEAVLRSSKLSGTIIGTTGSWGNNPSTTRTAVFDGFLNTFFDSPNGTGWAGLNFGTGVEIVITQIKFCPRADFPSRMVGGVFQGANRADFVGAVTLYTVTSAPTVGQMTTVNIGDLSGYQYVRYLSPSDGYGNVAEVEFYGYTYFDPVEVPSAFSAQAVSANAVNLTWNAATDAIGYNVKRSTTSGGPYETIAANISGTSYTDTSVNESSYYYVVNTVTAASESANSEEMFVFAYPWSTTDVGSAQQGSAVVENDTFTVEGSGADIWDRSDAFRYVYTEMVGDCSIMARVTSVENTDVWAKGGVMIRKSLDADSANALICVTPGNGVSFQWRASDGSTSGNSNTSGLAAPYWVKLVRSGDSVRAYRSSNGTTWTQPGSAQTISMGSSVYIGLAVTAHNESLLSTATFDQVTLTGTAPAVPTNLEAVSMSANQINLSWTASANADRYLLKRSLTSGGNYSVIASNLTSVAYSDTADLTVGTRYYYVVSAANAGGESGASDEASAVPSAAIAAEEYQIVGSVSGGTNVNLSVSNSALGHEYQIWTTESLTDADWQPVGAAQAGTGSILDFNVPVEGDASSRYFKLNVHRQ